MEWQPIESAPKDGTPILVWLKEASLCTHIHSARLMEDGKPSIIGHHFAFDVGEPTHWMPLPQPPQTK